MKTRLFLVVFFVVVSAHAEMETAGAQEEPTPTCGQPDPASNAATVARGTLTLDEQSKTTIAYGRDTDRETLSLLFNVAECSLPADAAEPSVAVRPKSGAGELPDGVISLRDAVADSSTLEVSLNVDPEAFDPGSYEAYIALRAPYLVTSRTPVAVSRSEDNPLVPALIGVVSGLVGFLWLGLSKLVTTQELTIKWPWVIPVALAAAVFGVLAVGAHWWDQEVWSVDENLKGAISAGITGATTGSMLGLIGALWKAKTPQPSPDKEIVGARR